MLVIIVIIDRTIHIWTSLKTNQQVFFEKPPPAQQRRYRALRMYTAKRVANQRQQAKLCSRSTCPLTLKVRSCRDARKLTRKMFQTAMAQGEVYGIITRCCQLLLEKYIDRTCYALMISYYPVALAMVLGHLWEGERVKTWPVSRWRRQWSWATAAVAPPRIRQRMEDER